MLQDIKGPNLRNIDLAIVDNNCSKQIVSPHLSQELSLFTPVSIIDC
jgi:hypothetical protein